MAGLILGYTDKNKPDTIFEMDSALGALRQLIGEATVVEDDTGVIAYAKLSNDAVYKGGAEKRT